MRRSRGSRINGARTVDPARGEPRDVPRDRISFPDARASYGWLKDNVHLALAEELGNREDLPVRILHWTPAQIDAATLEILERTSHAR